MADATDMASFQIDAISACTPARSEENRTLDFDDAELDRLIRTTGIEQRPIAMAATTAADLCYRAALDVFDQSTVRREEIACLLYVTQTPDHQLPSTAHSLQHRLGLPPSCVALQLNEGCSGYVYGLYLADALLRTRPQKKVLLLVGDTISKLYHPLDKSTRPLFGDAGTATVVSYSDKMTSGGFVIGGDGAAYNDIIVPAGGARMPFDAHSKTEVQKDGLTRSPASLHLDGMNVFTFGITRVPKIIKELLANTSTSTADIDFFIFHQANRLMNEKIRKKLKLLPEQVPYSLPQFGNTSGASIPITMVTQLERVLRSQVSHFVLCGFGVGVSWAAIQLKIGPLQYVNHIQYEHE